MSPTRALRSYEPLPPIHTIKDLVSALRSTTAGDYSPVLAAVDIPEEELRSYCRWNQKHYTRTAVERTPEFELLVVCYEPGQRTSIHDYDSHTAWIHAISGEVIEERFKQVPEGLVRTNETKLRAHSFSCMYDGFGIHRFTNAGAKRAITLNLYARPLSKWKVYDERTGAARSTLVGNM